MRVSITFLNIQIRKYTGRASASQNIATAREEKFLRLLPVAGEILLKYNFCMFFILF